MGSHQCVGYWEYAKNSCSYIPRLRINPHKARGMQSHNKHNGSGISTEPTQEYMDQPILETSMT